MKPIPLQKYFIDYRVLDPELKPAAVRNSKEPILEFAAAGYDADGTMLNGVLNEAFASKGTAPAGENSGIFRGEQEIDLPPGATWLRVAVRDGLTDRTGTIEVTLPLKSGSPNDSQ